MLDVINHLIITIGAIWAFLAIVSLIATIAAAIRSSQITQQEQTMTLPIPAQPTPIQHRGQTHWLIASTDRYHTLQHTETGDLLNIFANEHDYPTIAAQITAHRIHQAIRRERAYQDAKYGTIAQRKLFLDNYLGIARRELEEARTSLANGDRDNARCELLQVAAVAIAALEAHGLIERDNLSPHNKRL